MSHGHCWWLNPQNLVLALGRDEWPPHKLTSNDDGMLPDLIETPAILLHAPILVAVALPFGAQGASSASWSLEVDMVQPKTLNSQANQELGRRVRSWKAAYVREVYNREALEQEMASTRQVRNFFLWSG